MPSVALRVLAVLALTAITMAPGQVRAWGKEGHETVAMIAAARLTPAAAEQVKAMLGADLLGGMVAASTWPDEVKPQRPQTAPWHFVDIPLGSAGYDAARDCRNHDCIVDQITITASRVADRSLLAPVRAEALRFLIHFVGDVHQPLHAMDNDDRGGNDVYVSIGGGRVMKLHHVWDTEVVEEITTDRASLAHRLQANITPAQAAAWSQGTPESWANESFAVAGANIYGKLGISGTNSKDTPILLPASYLDDVEQITEQQLAKAGVRLAWLLNSVFSR